MKRIKLSLICTAALMLALPLAGCMNGDSGNASKQDVEQKIETQSDENGGCPDGKCPEDDGKTDRSAENGDCENGEKCPDGKCPAKRMPHARHGNGRAVPLPHPHRGN